jgi:hypothetical protein
MKRARGEVGLIEALLAVFIVLVILIVLFRLADNDGDGLRSAALVVIDQAFGRGWCRGC